MKLISLKTNVLGRNFVYYEILDSTQKEVWRLIENNTIRNGTLVMADIQTSAVGTHGRVWHTDEKDNIAFSFYLEMNCNLNKISGLTMDVAECLTNIILNKYNLRIDIKSPNDLMINGKKIGGILTESRTSLNKVKYLVIGIGINTSKMSFTNDIENIATSIKKETGIVIDREYVVSNFCNSFEQIIKERVEI